MADLSDIDGDPTLEAMYAAVEAAEAAKPTRKRNLGVSKLGDECERKIYYHINDYQRKAAGASLLFAGEDGYHCEDVMAKRLRMVPGIELWTIDEATGKQIGFVDMDGRLKGYADGVILGLLQAPKTPHIWEAKSKNLKLFAEFQKLKKKFGEKNVLREWNFDYFVQAQMLMGYLQLDRHYTTVCTQGAREVDSCRTEFDKVFFEAQKQKAARLIGAKSLPERAYLSPAFFKCRFCDFADECWKD